MTRKRLETEISDIVSTLYKQGKQQLAKCIEENWDKTAIEYSRELNTYRPSLPMEKELENAFDHELKRLDFDDIYRKKIISSIARRRVMQTAPHLGATEGPRMLCINWLGSLGVPDSEFYVAGMFSGIPFSNRSRPGRINRKDDGVNLLPSTMQDALVYRSKITDKLLEETANLPKRLLKFLPAPASDASYTKWALKVCTGIERKILNKNNLVYLDINEVIAEYLTRVLGNKTHVLHKLFFKTEERKQFTKVLGEEIIFYVPIVNGKYDDNENMFFAGGKLKSKNKEILLDNPKVLIEEIRAGRVCPSLIITFITLSFLNQFKCFGSFAQVEYLPVYQEKLARLAFMKTFKIEKVPTSNLTTGVFPDETEIFPADLIITDKILNQKKTLLFGELLLAIKDTLIGSYFTGNQRINNQNGNK